MWQQGAAAGLHNNIALRSRKDTLREESSVNMKIIIGLRDLHAELPSLTMLDLFLSVTSMTRFGTYPAIHMQSTNIVKLKTAFSRLQTYYKAINPKSFLFHEGRMQKMYACSMGIILIINKMRTIFE